MSHHPGAWVAWTVAVLGIVIVRDDPAMTLAVFASVIAVAVACAPREPTGRAWALFLRLGLIFLVARVVLFGLTGHTGPTTLFTLPQAHLPAILGGLTIGGRVTAEVLAASVFEGAKIAVILVSIGVAQSLVPPHRAIRMLPRFLFEAGLMVGIAVTFVPTLMRTASDVRDAQRARGINSRGMRGWRALVLPLLGTALERSLTLAASMEVRGFGRGGSAVRMRERAVLATGALLATAGAALAAYGRPVGAVLMLGAMAAMGLALRSVGARIPRTRLRPQRWRAADTALVMAAAVAVGIAVLGRAIGPVWSPYPSFVWPGGDASILAAAVVLAPIAIARRHAARIGAVEQRPDVRPMTAGVTP